VTLHIAIPTPDPDGRLAQLLAHYDLAKAERDKAAEAFDAIADGIKAELAQAAPGMESVTVTSPDLAAPLRLQAVTAWRVDAKKLKAEAVETYVRYATQSTSWRLSAVK
jgi:hypothetical protein